MGRPRRCRIAASMSDRHRTGVGLEVPKALLPLPRHAFDRVTAVRLSTREGFGSCSNFCRGDPPWALRVARKRGTHEGRLCSFLKLGHH